MRWITFAILLYVFAACQVAGLAALGGNVPAGAHQTQPEFLILLAVFYALYAAEDSAGLAALCCGVALDLLLPEPLGTNALPWAPMAWLIVRVRLSIFREHLVSQFVMSFFAILLFGVASGVFRVLVPWVTGTPGPGFSIWGMMAEKAGNAFYSALLAPAIFWVLMRLPILGFNLRGPRAGR